MIMHRALRRRAAGVALLIVLAMPMAALADPITKNLGGGWRATIFDPVYVDIVVDFVSIKNDILVIEKFAQFVGVDPITGLPKPVQILFEQIESDKSTVSRIVLTDQIIVNHTGIDWTSYREELIPTESGVQTFNQALSATFSIAPFTTRTYNGISSIVDFAGGVVPNGSTWAPGVESGGLYIDIDLESAEKPVAFTLKELPIPEPGAALMVLLAAGVGAVIRRR